MNIKYYTIMLAVVLGMTACGSESTTPKNGDDQLATEGSFENTVWIIENAQLPTENLRSKYERMELRVDQDLNYSWIWTGKPGWDTYDFEGDTYYEKSQEEHSSGSAIYNLRINVVTINDIEVAGGWYGIFTFEDENNLVLNVEPDVENWGEHPTAAGGVGSGREGEGSVYRFVKQ